MNEDSVIFSPIDVGSLTIRNRLEMAPMLVGYASPEGYGTERIRSYFEARAEGGVGLITIEGAIIKPEGRCHVNELGIYSTQHIPGLADIADTVKVYGATASIQLIHAGIQSTVLSEVEAPSSVRRDIMPEQPTPRKLETVEAEQIVKLFGDAALRAKKAGFDMVQVHGTHGYLINQFLSPLTNKRDDKYGINKTLFAIEVVESIKEKCGKDFPVDFRLQADEFQEGGIRIDFAKEVAKKLEDAGVNKFNVTGGTYDTTHKMALPMHIEKEGLYEFFDLASQIKEVVDVPVSSGGFISDPKMAEKAIEEELVDMVFLGRQLLADPDWPRKAKHSPKDIKPCIACNECIERIRSDKPVWCTVNSFNGYEYKWKREEDLQKTEKKKRVLVIGAGPGGLEAARISSIRGHDVVLVDSSDRIGGTLKLGSIPNFKRRLKDLIEYYKTQLNKLDLEVRLNTEADPELIREIDPDFVVVATGSKPVIPNIPGVEKAIIADDVLEGKAGTGDKVIVAGGGFIGCEVALYLVNKGKRIIIIEALPEIGADMEKSAKYAFTRPGGFFETKDIEVKTNSPIIEINDQGAIICDGVSRNQIEANTTVLAVGRKSLLDGRLVDEAEKVAKRVEVIGDAKKPRKIIDAIHEGFTIGRGI